jgi:hypothetical protein
MYRILKHCIYNNEARLPVSSAKPITWRNCWLRWQEATEMMLIRECVPCRETSPRKEHHGGAAGNGLGMSGMLAMRSHSSVPSCSSSDMIDVLANIVALVSSIPVNQSSPTSCSPRLAVSDDSATSPRGERHARR